MYCKDLHQTVVENKEFKSEISFLEFVSESIYFIKNHFFTNKNILL